LGIPVAGSCVELALSRGWPNGSGDNDIILELAIKKDQIMALFKDNNKPFFFDSLSPFAQDFGLQYNLKTKELTLELDGFSESFSAEEKIGSTEDQKSIGLPMQKNIGPLSIKHVGIKPDFANGMIWIPIEASVSSSILSFGLNGFELGIPLGKDKNIDVRLSGLSLDIRKDPVEIGGGFLKVGSNEYFGEALIKIKNFSLSALGSYSSGSEPSLFVFALLSYPIGGPSCFYVTGLAAGFGYNRTLKIPEVDQLAEFPLVSYATSTYATSDQKPSLGEIQKNMGRYIPPSAGDFWLAAGVKFTSFNMINSFALLTVRFGTKLEIALLGRSIMDVPCEGRSGSGLLKAAHAELLIKVKFDPEHGVIAATGILGPNSYVLSKDCRLTGGFAFYTWFNGEKKGDFVLSLGGYHPDFKRPDHYPIVPRLALNWQISPSLSVKGDGYFALTPSCAMAGLAIEARYHEGNLTAWFNVHADFLLEWEPFHYDIQAGISIGVSYLVHILGIKKLYCLELGASAHLWGPDFSGEVHITWSIFSFTVKFGADRRKPPRLSWEEFSESFLPKDNSGQVQPINVMIARGLLKEVGDMWMVNPFDFSILIQSSIPSTSIKFNEEKILPKTDSYHIRPMGKSLSESCMTIRIAELSKNNIINSCIIKENLPKAIWGDDPIGPSAEMIEAPVGLQLIPKRPKYQPIINCLKPRQIEPKPICWENPKPPSDGCSNDINDIRGLYALLKTPIFVSRPSLAQS
jgi:hypothetical protein